MPKSVYVKLVTFGQDSGPFNITNNAGETVATGVTKIDLANGVSYTMADGASSVTINSTGTCTNGITIPVTYVPPAPTPTPTPTPTPSPTPTPTPTPTGTPSPITLTLSYLKVANRFQISLSESIGADIYVNSVFADGYADSPCINAIASAADVRNILALPANSNNYAWTPQTVCGGSVGNTSCWANATKHTMYNVNINGISVYNGSTITVGGVEILINIPPCRQL